MLPPETLPDGAGVKLTVTSDGALWLALREGVARYDRGKWTTYSFNGDTRSLTASPDGTLWVGVDGGVYHFADGKRTVYRATANPTEGLPDPLVADIAIDRNGVVWVATAGGVARFDGKVWARYSQADGLIQKSVIGLAASPDGTLWFGYPSGGISHFVP